MARFRRRIFSSGHQPWHWKDTCRDWPTDWYLEREVAPTNGDLCPECQAIDAEAHVEPVHSPGVHRDRSASDPDAPLMRAGE
jgi:hypothetical protein